MNKLSNFVYIFRGWSDVKIPITESVELNHAFFLAFLVKGANATKSRSFFLAHGLPSSVVIGVVLALLIVEVLVIVQFDIIHLEILL